MHLVDARSVMLMWLPFLLSCAAKFVGGELGVNGLPSQLRALEGRINQLENDRQQQQQENAAIRQELAALRESTSQRVSFQAFVNNVGYTTGQKLPGNTHGVSNIVVFNEGRGFDDDTGIFTAPVSGTYLFLASIKASGGGSGDNYKHTFICITVEGSGYGSGRAGCMHIYDKGIDLQGNCHAIVRLSAGAKVYLELYSERASVFNGIPVSMFSGVLVRPYNN